MIFRSFSLFQFLFEFLIEFLFKNCEKKDLYLQALTWRAAADVVRGTASGCDAALRPRGRARVARTGGAKAGPRGSEATRSRERPCGAPRGG